MVCTFIKSNCNNKELYTALVFELQNNNISYSTLISIDKIYRVKAECSKSQIKSLEISSEFEFEEYDESKKLKNNGLEDLIGSYKFQIENKFLQGHFENVLTRYDLPVIFDVNNNNYRVKNRNVWLVESEWLKEFEKLDSLDLVDGEYKIVEDGNTFIVQKMI